MEFVVAVWEKINNGGPAVIFVLIIFIWWLLEDRKTIITERNKAQDQNKELTVEFITTANRLENSIAQLNNMLLRVGGKSQR